MSTTEAKLMKKVARLFGAEVTERDGEVYIIFPYACGDGQYNSIIHMGVFASHKEGSPECFSLGVNIYYADKEDKVQDFRPKHPEEVEGVVSELDGYFRYGTLDCTEDADGALVILLAYAFIISEDDLERSMRAEEFPTIFWNNFHILIEDFTRVCPILYGYHSGQLKSLRLMGVLLEHSGVLQ